jgi:peptide/nickel transport system substrate-binding protein
MVRIVLFQGLLDMPFRILMTFFLLFASLVNAAQLRISLDADPVSLDPHEQLSEGALQYSHTVFDPLLRWRKDGSFEPRLATSWQRIDSTTLRLHLRQGVRFHTGNPFTAEDVVYTIARLKSSTDFKALFTVIDTTTVIDDYTMDIHTKQPAPLLLNILAYVFTIDKKFYLGRDQIIKFGNSFAASNSSGTGPFRVVERVQGEKLVLERNPDYWDKNSPGNVTKLELIPIHSDSTRLAALLTGDVDVISPIASIDIERVKRTPGIELVSLPGTRIVMLQLNQARRPELRDVRVRRAISLAINQQLIVDKILRGYGQAAEQLSAQPFMGHIEGLTPEYNLEQARDLMRQAGYEQGFSLTLMAPNNRYMSDEQIAQAVAAMLEKINIRVDFKTLPKAQYFQLYDQRAADIMMLGWQSDTLDSNNIFEFTIACTDSVTGLGAYNVTGYCNDSISKSINSANKVLNPTLRRFLLQSIERQIASDVPVIPLHWQDIIWVVKKGINLEPVLNSQNYPYLGDLVVNFDKNNALSAGGSN